MNNQFNIIIKIFISVYSYIKIKENQTDETIIQESFSIFQTLINLLDESTLTKVPKDILNLILHSIKDEQSLHNEIDYLKKYFNKEDLETNALEEKLLLLSQKEVIVAAISDIIFIINIRLKKQNIVLN